MDERIISLLEEQNALLKKHLWRLRFSLLTLLILTTGLSIGLGNLVYQKKRNTFQPTVSSITQNGVTQPVMKMPNGQWAVMPEVGGVIAKPVVPQTPSVFLQ